jgi:hypothetical protein
MAYSEKSGETMFLPFAMSYQPYALIEIVGAVRSGLYEGAIALTTWGAVTIMRRFIGK